MVGAEAVQELDGAAAADAEEFFEEAAVDNGEGELFEFGSDGGKLQKPLGLAGHKGTHPIRARICTVVQYSPKAHFR